MGTVFQKGIFVSGYQRSLLPRITLAILAFWFVVFSWGCATPPTEESKPKVMTGYARRGTGRNSPIQHAPQ